MKSILKLFGMGGKDEGKTRKAKLQITPGRVSPGRGTNVKGDGITRQEPYVVEVEMDSVVPLKEGRDNLVVTGMWYDSTVTLKSDTLAEQKIYGPPATVNLEVGKTAEFYEKAMDSYAFWEVKLLSFNQG